MKMSDEEVANYLYKFENIKTYNQIIKATKRTYEELKKIYSEKVIPRIHDLEEPKNKCINSLGEKYIYYDGRGRKKKYHVSYYPKNHRGFSKYCDTLEEAIKIRDIFLSKLEEEKKC